MQLKQTIWENVVVILMTDVIMNPARGSGVCNRDHEKICKPLIERTKCNLLHHLAGLQIC